MQDPDDYKSHSSSDAENEVTELRSQSALKDHASNVVASTPSHGGKKSALSEQKDSAGIEKDGPSKGKKDA